MSRAEVLIQNEVRELYERFPFPQYPLYVPLRWREAYLSSAFFSASLCEYSPLYTSSSSRVLIAGCGDTQPYIIRKFEPQQIYIDAIDLSMSNIKRASKRFLRVPNNLNLVHSEIDAYLSNRIECYDHVECYGVLHHLANPSRTLEGIYRSLKPGGTLRLMVYNSDSRTWIAECRKVLSLLGCSFDSEKDVKRAQKYLLHLADEIPILKERLTSLGCKALRKSSIFVDTFLHVREARLSIDYWFDAISCAGFLFKGLFDRSGELDDLNNPFQQVPLSEDLSLRASDRRFEHNLELFVQKPFMDVDLHKKNTFPGIKHLLLSRAPQLWFAYRETNEIPVFRRQQIWWHYLRRIYHRKYEPCDSWIRFLSIQALQRLARLGVINSSLFQDASIRGVIDCPMADDMECPERVSEVSVGNSSIPSIVESFLLEQGLPISRRSIIVERLQRLQM